MAVTGKAAVFHGLRKPFELTELPLPEVEPRGVLIRVTVANICGSDLHFWRGESLRDSAALRAHARRSATRIRLATAPEPA